MTPKKFDFAIFSRRGPRAEGHGASAEATPRRGAGRRGNRARHPALEAMEDRLVMTTYTTLPSLSMAVISGTGSNVVTKPVVPSGGFPDPGAQPGGDVVCATFSLPSNYSGPAMQVGLADYTSATYPAAPPFTSTLDWLNAQVYFGSSTAILSPGHTTATVYVNLAHCQPGHDFFQQADAFFETSVGAPDNHGGVVTQFSGSDYYGYPATANNHLLGGAILTCTPAGAPGAYSQGYYKNHPEALPSTMAIGNQVYTRDQLVTLLQTNPKGGDATLINVHQLITSYANLENGTALTSNVSDAIRSSEAIFDTMPILIDSHGNYNTAATTKSSTANGTILTNAASVLETINP